MERSLLVSLLCVWALGSLSAASGECLCAWVSEKKLRIMGNFPSTIIILNDVIMNNE